MSKVCVVIINKVARFNRDVCFRVSDQARSFGMLFHSFLSCNELTISIQKSQLRSWHIFLGSIMTSG